MKLHVKFDYDYFFYKMGIQDEAVLSDLLDPSGKGHCSQQELIDFDTIMNGNSLPYVHVLGTFEFILADKYGEVPKHLFMPVSNQSY